MYPSIYLSLSLSLSLYIYIHTYIHMYILVFSRSPRPTCILAARGREARASLTAEPGPPQGSPLGGSDSNSNNSGNNSNSNSHSHINSSRHMNSNNDIIQNNSNSNSNSNNKRYNSNNTNNVATCLTPLVECGLVCFMRCLQCQGSSWFATFFATFEEKPALDK